MKQRTIGALSVSAIGLGCMNLSHAYGAPPAAEAAESLLLRALDLGVTLFDTAALYGFGTNETLVGRVLKSQRSKIVLASKGGMTGVTFSDGVKRVIDGRPESLKRDCEASLRRLQTDVIDLYYLHRWDKRVPIEDSVGAMSDLVRRGLVRELGLSEVSAATFRRAHAVHPIAAVQNEYSLWSRNVEIGVLEACRSLGVALVAFSPLARAFLTGTLRDTSGFDAKDIRRGMPRFQDEHFAANLRLLDGYTAVARELGCTPGQVALAWLLARGDQVVPIPGTTSLEHLAENMAALDVSLNDDVMARLDALINRHTVSGRRYNAVTQTEIDTEEFAA
jgi:aryl-alcohol dehydrogenase-like predicted oxidoreductase